MHSVQFHLNRLMVYECSKSNRDIDPVLFEFQHKKLVPVLLQVHVVKSTRTYLYLCVHTGIRVDFLYKRKIFTFKF